MKRATLGWLIAALLLPSSSFAVSTKSFVIDTSDGFEKGTFKGASAHSSGKLVRSLRSERTAIEGVPVGYASTVGRDGAIYVATGNEGAVYRADAQGVKLFADTDAALLTSLVWADDTLYAGSLPGGRVFAIARDGKVRELAKLPGVEHVWALRYSARQRTLFAATGPEGKLFAIDATGRSELLHDDEAEHLLALDLDAEGRLYAGTSNGARLLRITGKKVEVLYDFPGQELTELAVGPSFIAAASNEFPAPPPPIGDGKDLGAAARTKRLKPGKGSVYTLDFTGYVEELGRFDSAHVSALEIDPTGNAVLAGLAQDGRIVRLTRGGERAVWIDVDERQIAAIHLQSAAPHFLSSDGVAIHRVLKPDGLDERGEWISAVLDAKAPARFGELAFRGRGGLFVATRSGNTETPDASWSAWSQPSTSPGPIKSPPARFLQLRVELEGDAELYAVEAFYLPQNQAARLRNVRPKATPARSDDLTKPRATTIALTWEVENPDDDKLRYRVHVRREGQAAWLPLQREHELLEQTDYTWETRAIPDGYYRARVTVSDEATNPEPYVTRSEAISAPILVDNRAPELRDLRYGGGKLSGRAVDALGPIRLLELSIDAGLYRPIAPLDDLLDTKNEAFSVPVGPLAPGAHTLSVRTADEAQNITSAALEVSVPTP